jgi:hypothetical protein
MNQVIDEERFTREFFDVFTETFETHHGIFLDRSTSLFETLAGITAEEASRPVGGKCATLAAQVTHVKFYLEVLERYMLEHDAGQVDWGEIWRTVAAVTPAEWDGLQRALKDTYRRILDRMQDHGSWNDDFSVASALAMVVHSAYHLGEIRQALCTLR